MLSEIIEPTIMVAEYDNFYLIYDELEYHLGVAKENTIISHLPVSTKPQQLTDILNSADYDGIETINNKKDKTKAEQDLLFLYSHMDSNSSNNGENILFELITILADISEEIKQNGSSSTNKDILNNINDDKVISKIKELSEAKTIEKNSKIFLADGGKKGDIIQVKNNKELKEGLYYEKMIKKGDDYEPHYTLIGNITIQELKLTYDKLNLFTPVTTIKYTNTTTNQTVTLEKKPYEAIANNLINDRLIDSNSLGVENLLNKIWVQGVNKIDFITAETDLLKDGFFMDMENNKVLSNNVFNDLETTPKDIKEAIKLFNELIKNRGTAIPNDCTLFRFMLWSPFAYCLKQLGFTDGLYSMVLWGVTDTNKTGSSVMFSNLYTDKDITLQKANTQSAIGTRLGENTFPLILDEAKDNLTNPNDEEFNKNIVTDDIGRAVKDRTNNNLMVSFPALRLTVRTLNQDIEYKDEFLKRHKVLYYDGSMQVKEADKLEFNKKYKPNSPATPLHQLKHIGKAFAERFIPYLESQSDELYDLEDLTIKILEQIEKDFQVSFNLNTKIKQKLTNQSRDTGSIIKTGLNKMFTSSYKIPYGRSHYDIDDFINSTDVGAVRWLDYQPKNKVFIIKVNEFEQDITKIVGEHKPIAETMELLNIKYDNNNGKNIKFRGIPTKAVKLSIFDLTYKLFNIRVSEFEELQAEEEEKEQREAEANQILNRESI